MKDLMKNVAFYCLIALLLGLAVRSFFFANQQKSTTIVQVSSSQININNIMLGEIKDTVIYLKNIGDEILQLDTIGTDCGCTVAKWHKKPIRNSEQTPITIRFEAKEEGIILRKVQIYANIKPNPLIINVKATVKNKK